MSDYYKRLINIEGLPGNPSAHALTITDARTGEVINYVKSAILYLDGREASQAELTYYEHHDDGSLVIKDDDTVEGKAVVPIAKVSVTALERLQDIEGLIYQALGEASMCWSETPTGVFDCQHADKVGKQLMQDILHALRQSGM